MSNPQKLKRVVIKEELVALTGDYVQAIILNQFIYWSERTKDFDQYIAEERQRDPLASISLTHGWVYKSAEELNKELMLGMSDNTIRRYLKKLIDADYLNERNNPKLAWDRTLQYRPNMIKIQTDLQAMGYALEGYQLVIAFVKTENGTVKTEDRTLQNDDAIPEITTENTTEILANSKKPQTNGKVSGMAERVEHLADSIVRVAKYDNDEAIKGATKQAIQICKVCQIDLVSLVDRKTKDELINLAIAHYNKSVTPADYDAFVPFYKDTAWEGQKGQTLTPRLIGNYWGQFEAASNGQSPQPAIPSYKPDITPEQMAVYKELMRQTK